MSFTTGAIIAQGSPNVKIGGQRAARAGLDGASCDGAHSFHHIGMPAPTALIAQGSSTVHINGRPAARMGDKLICGGDIKTGQGNVLIGGVANPILPIDDAERQFKDFLIGMGLFSAVLGLGAAFVGVSSFAGFLSELGGIAKGVGAGAAFLLASRAAEKYLPAGWDQIAAGVIEIVGFATMAKVFEGCGDPTVINESLWGESHFSYDADGRLSTASRQFGVSEHFMYDEAGGISSVRTGGFRESASKRPAMGTVELRFMSDGGRLEKVGEASYFYDANGHTIEKRVRNRRWRYEWTTEGQLRAVVTPEGERWMYEYDPFGRRIKKTGPRGTTIYVWDGPIVAQEITPERSSSWLFEPGTFRPIAKLENGKPFGAPADCATACGTKTARIRIVRSII